MNTVYDPHPLINRIEAFANRLAGVLLEIEGLIDNNPEMPLEGTITGFISHKSIEARLQQYLDASDPCEPDFLDRIQRVSDGIDRVRRLNPKWTTRDEDPHARALYPVLQGILSNTIVTFSDIKDIACRFFVAYYREFGMSDEAKMGMLRHSDSLPAFRVAIEVFSEEEAMLKALQQTGGQAPSLPFIIEMLETALRGHDELSEKAKYALNKLDYTRLFGQFASTLMHGSDMRGATFDTARDLTEASTELKKVMLAVMPYSLIDVKYEPDPTLLGRIAQLEQDLDAAQTSYLADTSGEFLDVREIVLIQEQHPEYRAGEIADLEWLRDFEFTHVKKSDRIARDCEEVIIAAKYGAFKLATVGCGGLLESVLREFVHRNRAVVDALKGGSDWAPIFARKSAYVKESDIISWDLHSLISVSALIFRQDAPELAGNCHKLRAARNKIHGGGVGKDVCTFAISVLKEVMQFLK